MKSKHEYVYCDCGGSYPPEPFHDRCPFCRRVVESGGVIRPVLKPWLTSLE